MVEELTDPFEITQVLKRIFNYPEFQRYAEAEALKMITHLFTDAGRTWRQAARVNSQGREIYKALLQELNGPIGIAVTAQINHNAEIIRTMPLSLAQQITDYIANESYKGRRASDIAKDIQQKLSQYSKAKAALIARTEVSKASTALTRARAENLGLGWYVWRTSKDSRVRDSHKIMDDVICSWNEPPAPEELAKEKSRGHYNPGEIFNCRCYPEPVISPNALVWPHKVYRNGSIERISLTKFKKLGG